MYGQLSNPAPSLMLSLSLYGKTEAIYRCLFEAFKTLKPYVKCLDKAMELFLQHKKNPYVPMLGTNPPGANHLGANLPRGQIFLGGKSPGGEFSGANFLGANLPGANPPLTCCCGC